MVVVAVLLVILGPPARPAEADSVAVATWGCNALRYELNAGTAGPRQRRALHRAVQHLAAVTGRGAVFVGPTDDRRSDGERSADEPILVEFYWPADAPAAAGFAEPFLQGDHYVGGSLYLHTDLAEAPARLVRRIAIHELGHLAGLAHNPDPDSALHPDAPRTRFTAADRAALATTMPPCG
jgi:hypothetical protein